MPTDNSPKATGLDSTEEIEDLDVNNTFPKKKRAPVRERLGSFSLWTKTDDLTAYLELQVAKKEAHENLTFHDRYLKLFWPKRFERRMQYRTAVLIRRYELHRHRLTDYPRIPPELVTEEENPPKDSQPG